MTPKEKVKPEPEAEEVEGELLEMEDPFALDFDHSLPIAVFAENTHYEADDVRFYPHGVLVTREGIDKVFLPWISVTKVFQKAPEVLRKMAGE